MESSPEILELLRQQTRLSAKRNKLIGWVIVLTVGGLAFAGCLAYSANHSKTDLELWRERTDRAIDRINSRDDARKAWQQAVMDLLKAHGFDK